MRDGWTEAEIQAEIDRQIADNPADKDLIMELAAEAKVKGNSWPLQPKFVAPPPLHLNEFLQ